MMVLSKLQRVRAYVVYDLRDIVWPRPLPDPPGVSATEGGGRSLTIRQMYEMLKRGLHRYAMTWKVERGRKDEEKGKEEGGPRGGKEEEVLLDDAAGAARAGSKVVTALVQNSYKERLLSYREAVKEFIVGYKEGFREEMAEVEKEEEEK